jgi:hypothetical protein
VEAILALGLLGGLAFLGWSLTDRRPRPRTLRRGSQQAFSSATDGSKDINDVRIDVRPPTEGQGARRDHEAADDGSAGDDRRESTVNDTRGAQPPGLAAWGVVLAAPCLRAQIQLPYALQWVAMESGGNPCAVGDPRAHAPDGGPLEVGIAQFYDPDDLAALGIASSEIRACCVPGDQHETTYKGRRVRGFSQRMARPITPEEMVRQADKTVEFIHGYADRAATILASISAGPAWSRDRRAFWALVKLRHGLPGLVKSGLPAVTKRLGRPPVGWAEFRATVTSVPLDRETEKYRAEWPAILSNAERCANMFVEPAVA